jgi:4'-phosphopantetheinyl transferase
MAGLSPGERTMLVESWRTLLSAEELRRADGFRGETYRQDYITAHAALRFVLGSYLRILPAMVSISASDGTKPVLSVAQQEMEAIELDRETEPEARLDLRFNLSHTKGAVLIGVAAGREVGVDIEWQRPLDDLDGMARTVMSNEEISLWSKLEPERQMAAFYRLWTRKESYLKAIGLGLYRSLQDVTVPVFSDGLEDATKDCRIGQDRSGGGSWTVLDIPAWRGYAASVCWEGADRPLLTVRDLDIAQQDLAAMGDLD